MTKSVYLCIEIFHKKSWEIILKETNKSNHNKLKFVLGVGLMLGVTALGVTSNSAEADASTRNGNIITVQSGDIVTGKQIGRAHV